MIKVIRRAAKVVWILTDRPSDSCSSYKMKSLIIIVIFLIVARADVENTSFNGRPGCRTLAEVGRKYANFFDSSRYWHCYSINSEPISERCPNQYGFQANLKTCVPYSNWHWEEPVMPPSCPDFEPECVANTIGTTVN